MGGVPKRKVRSRGPMWPKGSMAKGISVMLLCIKSPMTPSPGMDDPVVGLHLFPWSSFHFSKTWRCKSALADKIRRTSGVKIIQRTWRWIADGNISPNCCVRASVCDEGWYRC